MNDFPSCWLVGGGWFKPIWKKLIKCDSKSMGVKNKHQPTSVQPIWDFQPIPSNSDIFPQVIGVFKSARS